MDVSLENGVNSDLTSCPDLENSFSGVELVQPSTILY